ncbi:MAG: phosphoribosylglycinamide formyltransferase [Actinomycetota bacterium]|nr:phosphoribosylglycinamide formyltransferase [Actinomycetota bacterium]MDK1016594.1 phosphoribosylglycinamide formyltransferase [Actinomycetota bacterium]MDK1026358.1 phosphoribosylglycinamide formyltransferase [Actinomycetota bacterium]MDK1038794.1 phosphoribosylglycinamide formyltransferase [Actinomycetota bacterium]MDK1096301.1 phosphoribosylglycinamide formyltransferase [Actinomycetota bacterium]
MVKTPLPIAILISGSGSNLQALIDAERSGELGCDIAVVISDRSGVQGLDRAADAGLGVEVVDWSAFDSREAFSEAVCDAAQRYGARALVLAGFMRILTPNAITRFPNAIINVHPALLPSFPGARAVEGTLAYGVKLTGVTVHFVDEQVDHGPIISQEAIEVLPDDDADALHARIQEVEHRLLPEAVAAFARGNLVVDGRHVRLRHAQTEAKTG